MPRSDMPRDPWSAMAISWPWVPIYIRVMPDKYGQTTWAPKPYVELAHDLGRVQQRCTLAHELHHLEFGAPCKSFDKGNEQDVVEATARWLLPDLDEIGRTLAEFEIIEAARELGVTWEVLNDRLVSLTDDEDEQLAPLLKASNESA